jgi:hypothetical protein
MTQSIRERLPQVRVGEPRESGGLQVFGLYWEAPPGPAYRTLDEAVAAGSLEVNEVSTGGSVPHLMVVNKDDLAVFMMAGEHLQGGKQNRVLNASILIAGHSELPIPVSCVERGRWAYRSTHFAGSGSSSHSALRRQMHGQVTRSYRSSGEAKADQGEVWREVDRKLTETGSCSDTAHLDQCYEDSEHVLRPVLEQLPAPEGACGAVFAYGGKIVGFDLFDRPSTLARLWEKLVRAYAIDARAAGESAPVSAALVRAWLGSATSAKEETFKSAGLGDDVRLEGPSLVAACLSVEDRPVHVEAFAEAMAG